MNSADLGFSVLCVVWILEKLESLHYMNSGTYVYAVRACVMCELHSAGRHAVVTRHVNGVV